MKKNNSNFCGMATKIQNRRGAALIEHGILLGLLSVMSIGLVTSLGREVSEVFEVADDFGSLETAENYGISTPPGPVNDWTISFDQADAEEGRIPSYVTESNGVWKISLEPILSNFPEGQQLYFDASISQSGARTVGSQGQCAYTLRPISEFKRGVNADRGIIGGIASADSGTSDCTPNSTQTFSFSAANSNQLVPTSVESIDVFDSGYFCSSGATCVDGPILFGIRFYTK